MPNIAEAGFLSFISGILGMPSSAVAEEDSRNSQTMPLLRAPLSPSSNSSVGGGEVTFVDDSALISESGFIEGNGSLENTNGNSISLYVVRDGDSLSQIAKMFGVSVNTIIWANDLRNSTIAPGQQLVILPISGIKHKVKSGETLKGIVTKYKADLAEILKYNDLTTNTTLNIGDEIIIPDAELETVPSTGSTRSTGSGRFASYPSYIGYYDRPVQGGRKTQGIHGYNGVDLGASIGTPVMAAASGEIIVSRGSGWNGGYGNYIVISHDNGTQTLYAHLNSVLVYSGHVVKGQVIGFVGNTGKSTGSHLHFEVRGAKNPF